MNLVPPNDSTMMTTRLLFYILPAVTMSLGWALRGSIGGGPVGAMIPGAMVTLCLCHLLGWNRRVAIAAALGTIGVGLGGQVTYGQTIGFAFNPETVGWGLLGMTTKGAMWGLSGGVLVGLGLMHSKYKPQQILIGLALMVMGTAVGHLLVDEPRLMYFSNRLDKPREEIWFGLTLGAVCLIAWLLFLRRERVSVAIALFGMLGGAAGFGGGGLFFWLGSVLDDSFAGWPWWKMKEFTFGLLYGLALGAACDLFRIPLQQADGLGVDDTHPPERPTTFMVTVAAGVAVVFAGMFFQFTIPYRAIFSLVGSILIGISIFSVPLAWHVALSMTIVGFLRDCMYKVAEPEWVTSLPTAWVAVLAITVLVVSVVTWLTRPSFKTRFSSSMTLDSKLSVIEKPGFESASRSSVSAKRLLLGLTWLATLFGFIKLGLPEVSPGMHWFVQAMFIAEAVLVTLLLLIPTSPSKQVLSQVSNR